ncbi:MAG: hypothetical protein ACOCW1_03995, partial [Chitinispirillaceae bacterium]
EFHRSEHHGFLYSSSSLSKGKRVHDQCKDKLWSADVLIHGGSAKYKARLLRVRLVFFNGWTEL